MIEPDDQPAPVEPVDPIESAEPDAEAAEPIERWLGMLVRLSGLSARRFEPVRLELESHVRERARDLMLGGVEESQAVRRAIEEFGEAVSLARELRRSITHVYRRRIMTNVIVTGAAALLLAGATYVTVNQVDRSDSAIAVYQASEAVAADEPEPAYMNESVALNFEEAEFSTIVAFLRERVGRDVVVREDALFELNLDPESTVTIHLEARPLGEALSHLAARFEEPFAWRARPDHLEIASQAYFDAREAMLARYDIGEAMKGVSRDHDDRELAAERIANLIRAYVEPPAWEDNGGEVAHLTIVERTMFVEAPPRFHDRIAWILAQLEAAGGNDDGAASGAAGEGSFVVGPSGPVGLPEGQAR